MRVVAVADTHLFHDELVVPDGDILIHAGDMCRGGDLHELRDAARWLRSLPHRYKIVVAGNHDWALAPCTRDAAPCQSCVARDDPGSRGERCDGDAAIAREMLAGLIYLEDSEVTLEGLRIYGSPWQPEYNDWAFMLPRGAPLAAVWSRVPRNLDILVTHGPPDGIGDRSPVGGRTGCADLRARVADVAPRLHVFGHIHQDGGVWHDGATTFINATTWECERPPSVVDIDASSVTPVIIPPHGRRDDEW